MTWNWQLPDWPHFTYKPKLLEQYEQEFLHKTGEVFGICKHLNDNDHTHLKVSLISNEAISTSEIEGEYLDRNSIQSSIQRYFNLTPIQNIHIKPREQNITELILDLYNSYAMPLTHTMLHRWHKTLLKSRHDLEYIGCYRQNNEPMQIISGPLGNLKVHFEAPPASKLKKEMENFIRWFNQSAPNNSQPLPILTRSAIAHLYFETIHPFEDGNGRIGRALSEKVLSQSLRKPTLISLATIINKHKKQYYTALECANKKNEISEWIEYFATTIMQALDYTQESIEFIIKRNKLLQKIDHQLNARQKKLLHRMFAAGHEGFIGGLSSKNYISITDATQPTATRDLSDLVHKGALKKTGTLKSTRYFLNI